MIDAHFSSSASTRESLRESVSGSMPESTPGEPTSGKRVILVDGFNVLHAVLLGKERETGWWQRATRERLLRRASLWPERSDEVWIAFDGAQPAWSVWAEPVARIVANGDAAGDSPSDTPGQGPMVHNVHVESADDWIVRRARRAADPARTIVVSGDRKVAGRARSAGCEVWTPWAFVSHCPSPGGAAAAGDPASDTSSLADVSRPDDPPSCARSTTD
jgi:hypothetical protein